ncbi:hypothetical protein ABW20_dc0100897 [Dactylellina cionopaga]|nr:hypothetical protein ABW20_dc0100897 [Dactylellina cionopaga]
MSSSITTVVPTGTIIDWCVANQVQYGASGVYQCANETIGQKPSDFESICCDGEIVDTKEDLWQLKRPKSAGPFKLDLDDLVCCRFGREQGGIQAINPTRTVCTAGTPTPLASLAATNVDNARAYLVTYASASQGEGTSLGDWTLLTTPQCIWMNTNTRDSQGVGVKTVVVPAADITTLPAAATSEFGAFNGPPIESTADEPPQSTNEGQVTIIEGSSGTQSPVTTTSSAVKTTSAPSSASPAQQVSKSCIKNLLMFSMGILFLSSLPIN